MKTRQKARHRIFRRAHVRKSRGGASETYQCLMDVCDVQLVETDAAYIILISAKLKLTQTPKRNRYFMTAFKNILPMALLLGTLLTTGLASFAQAASVQTEDDLWFIDRPHSEISFSVRHFFTPVKGVFEDYEADIRFDPDNLATSYIEVDIAVNSVNTRNTDRDEHLQSEDFFNAAEWPEIHFRSERIEQRGQSYVAIGELTIRDVSRPFELPFTLLGIMENPMKEGTMVDGIQAETSLERNDYGVGTGSWAATAVVGGEVGIDLSLELTTEN